MKKSLLLFLPFLLLGCGDYYESADAPPRTPAPGRLLLEIADERRFVSIDEVADRIINQDPSLVLVDVRTAEQYAAFTLPGAINIPLSAMLDPGQRQRLDGTKYEIVFFSNGSVDAEKAWMLCRRQACPNTYIMKGGLNEWADHILTPEEPPQTASSQEWERYRQRRAACQFFAGAATALTPEPYVEPAALKPEPKTIPVKPKKKVVEEEEGC